MEKNRCDLTKLKVAEQYQTYKSIKKPKLWLHYPKSDSMFQNVLKAWDTHRIKNWSRHRRWRRVWQLSEGRKCRSAGCMYVI